MRFLLISLLAVLLVNIVQAQDYFDTTDDYKEEFKGEKVTLGKKKCTCSFMLEVDGDKCSGKGGCDKKCSGSGSVEIGRYSFTLKVKKGKATISKCKAEVESTPLPTTGGSGSGEEPITMPPAPGSGSGSGPSPPMGEGMQCRCKCNCPDGSGECDCDCNCPMQSTAMTCASGFTRVCPMVEDACPEDMDMICPMNAASRMGGAEAEGTGKGCQCVPDFLMSLVSPGMPPAAVRLGATAREAVEASIKVGKTQCKCSFDMAVDGLSCKKSKGRCDKKCNGAAKGVELMDGMYMLDIKVKKGKVTIAKCEVTPIALTGTGTGSGTGSGEEAGGMGSRCACVGKGMGGSGPPPPTGSGSGPVPPTGGPVLPTGGPVLPTEGPVPPTGTGSGSGSTPSPNEASLHVPGTPGSSWTEEEVEVVREKVEEMLNQDNYGGFHIPYPQCSDSRVGAFVCNGDVFKMMYYDPTKSQMGNMNAIGMRGPKTSRVIQLGFHDCLKYTDGTEGGAVNGCDGCLSWKGMGFEFNETWFVGNPDNQSFVNHFTQSYPKRNETDNNGLAASVIALEMIYTNASWPHTARPLNMSLRESGKSRADLWAFAANVALEIEIVRANFACDVDIERQQATILEGRDKCDIKLHRPIKFQYGRKDCIPEEGQDAPYKTSRHENHDNPWGHGDTVIANFNRDFDMPAEQTIALMAAHGIQSRIHNKIMATKYAWIGTPYLSNMFFRTLAEKPLYEYEQDVEGFEVLNVGLVGDKEGKPVDNYGYVLSCTAMWNDTTNGENGPCYFKKQPNLEKNSVQRSSSVYTEKNFGPRFAVDGFVTDYGWDFFSTDPKGTMNPWIELKLAARKTISSVNIKHRPDCCWDNFKNIEIRAGVERLGENVEGELININTVCATFEGPGGWNKDGYTIVCDTPIEADYITVQMREEGVLQINELTVNGEPSVGNFLQEKSDDDFLRVRCYDTRRKANNPNLDGELLKVPQNHVDENGEMITGGWWSVDPPADCCDDTSLLDIPGSEVYKIQQGGCKWVLPRGTDRHNFVMNYEMSMYQKFSVNENNRPHGCRGLEPVPLEEKGAHNIMGKERVECGKNLNSAFSSSGDSYSGIIDRFAEEHDHWAMAFLDGWERMLQNGYGEGELSDGPQNSWLGYKSWTKVEVNTDDFEKYIIDNTPAARITNNSAENPTIMSNEKDTFKDECGFKSGMTSWNKNFARCPKKIFDFEN